MFFYAATAGVDFLITPENLTFTAGQSAFDGIMQCATVEILDDEVLLFVGLPECYKNCHKHHMFVVKTEL